MSDEKNALFGNIDAIRKVIGAAQEASPKEKVLPKRIVSTPEEPPTPTEEQPPSGSPGENA